MRKQPAMRDNSALLRHKRAKPMPKTAPPESPCPCGKPLSYAACCAPYHAGAPAPTAEALMRSRYSAYVHGLEAYLLETWHSSKRPESLNLDSDRNTRWLGLEIKRHQETGDNTAIVEFVARYKIDGRAHRLHETSRFVREEGRWYYVDGEFPEERKNT